MLSFPDRVPVGAVPNHKNTWAYNAGTVSAAQERQYSIEHSNNNINNLEHLELPRHQLNGDIRLWWWVGLLWSRFGIYGESDGWIWAAWRLRDVDLEKVIRED